MLLKRILSSFAGIAVFILSVFATDMLSGKLYPPPAALDYHDPNVVKQYLQSLPLAASLFLLFGYGLGAFVGSIVATVISGRTAYRGAVIVGTAAALATASNSMTLGHPIWFLAVGVILSIGFAALGYIICRKKELQIEGD